MVVPVIVLLIIPIFLGIVYVTPFEQPKEIEKEVMSEESDFMFIHFILIGIWTIVLLRIILQIKKGTFKLTQRY